MSEGATAGQCSSNLLEHVHPDDQRFEPSRVRRLIDVCVDVHPWFEPSLSSNVSIAWGDRTHTSRNAWSFVKQWSLRPWGDQQAVEVQCPPLLEQL